MLVTLFDLDHTLLPLDTNQSWIKFLTDCNALAAAEYLPAAAQMKSRYLQGGSDPDIEFCEFFIGTLARFDAESLHRLRQQFVDQVVAPSITTAARALVQRHLAAGEVVAIITATNRFITAPVATLFGIDHLIATECEQDADRFTGRVCGTPSMRSGKLLRFDAWLSQGPAAGLRARSDIKTLRFYSDSINDQALLEAVDEPIAVNPDTDLQGLAQRRGWPIIDLH